MQLYLTPAAVGYLSQLILSGLITGYVLWQARRPARQHHEYWLVGFFVSITLFIATLFLEVALLPTQRLTVVYCQNTALAIALVFLIQFAYRFPNLSPSLRLEAMVAFLFSTLYALWEATYALSRFALLRSGIVEYRPQWSDYVLLAVLLWVPLAFLRRFYALNTPRGRWGARFTASFFHSVNREARTVRAFILIFMFVASLNLFNILRASYLLSVSLANTGISLGILVALLSFALVYLNSQPEKTSFIVKLVGVALTLMLAVLSLVGWVTAPASMAYYQPSLPNHRTIRFTPNARGGYDVTAIPIVFEDNLGEPLALTEVSQADKEIQAYCSPPLDFAFPFYASHYEQIYICNDGTIGIGQPLSYRDYQYHYGAGAPMIAALLVDLHPDISPGAVYVRRAADRLIATWDRQRLFRYPADEYTFQAVLHSDGVFEFSYRDVSAFYAYLPNDDPAANPWAIGAWPAGLPRARTEMMVLDALPFSSGPNGVAEDYLLEFRQHTHSFLAPLAQLILSASAITIVSLPLLLYVTLVRPLNALLRGVRQMKAGNYQVRVPVQYADEIGFLTVTFNSFAEQLDELIHRLEARVAARTLALDEANAQLRTEVAIREELITELKAFSHTLAHDLKAPLAIITGYGYLLQEALAARSESQLLDFSTLITETSNKMGRMIDGILMFASVRQADLRLEPLDMSVILAEVRHNLRPLIAQKGAYIVQSEDWPVILGNAQWIEQVWTNYLSNALKYGGRPAEGQPPVIKLGYSVQDDNKVRFWVCDNGQGIAPELQDRLFSPFERLMPAVAEGYGLGLSIVKRMIEKLGGAVGVDSALGQGSCFWFTLPVPADRGVAE